MGVAVHDLGVMKYTASQEPTRHVDSQSIHSLGYTLVASALAAIVTVALVLAILQPITAMGVGALGGASWLATRTLRRFYRTRRSAGWTRTVCVPKTGVCVEL